MIKKDTPIENINKYAKNTSLEVLGIKITELGEDYIVGTMPVDSRTHQPAGLLHGGASVLLMESLGSIGSSLIVDMEKKNVMGLDINANHLRAVKSGIVSCTGRIVHCGRRTHVWQLDIVDENNKAVATGRITIMITDK
jgi:1,4-dihydroxy-2-naphthoyl-CoA hydrolase